MTNKLMNLTTWQSHNKEKTTKPIRKKYRHYHGEDMTVLLDDGPNAIGISKRKHRYHANERFDKKRVNMDAFDELLDMFDGALIIL